MSLLTPGSPPTSGALSIDSVTVTISDDFYANLSQTECEQQERARRLYANDAGKRRETKS
ncbi:hypothetical protein BIW11_11901 [Tropilaelaps mercedesae]|uniref:Uncharacterized protein n=1 Tax=Tropilaelaps mercedesae TaxID=418985 RepID=A0A1V9X9G9_9ACAR|nr:hypothetical protein BIW11_11901 [Tropilaelaps mercedesae]